MAVINIQLPSSSSPSQELGAGWGAAGKAAVGRVGETLSISSCFCAHLPIGKHLRTFKDILPWARRYVSPCQGHKEPQGKQSPSSMDLQSCWRNKAHKKDKLQYKTGCVQYQ